MKTGDEIIKVDQVKTDNWEKLGDQIASHPNEKMTVTIERDNKQQKITMTPKAVKQNGKKKWAKLEFKKSCQQTLKHELTMAGLGS